MESLLDIKDKISRVMKDIPSLENEVYDDTRITNENDNAIENKKADVDDIVVVKVVDNDARVKARRYIVEKVDNIDGLLYNVSPNERLEKVDSGTGHSETTDS